MFREKNRKDSASLGEEYQNMNTEGKSQLLTLVVHHLASPTLLPYCSPLPLLQFPSAVDPHRPDGCE